MTSRRAGPAPAGSGKRGLLAELVSLPTGGPPLDGLWYAPPGEPRAAAMLMHGNGGNFYSGPSRFLPPHLVPRGVACLAFNRRGHDTITTRTRVAEGNAFQTAAQTMADNVTAREFTAGRGFASPVVIGHSNGGVYASRHVADHPGAAALILLSAHCGGPEMLVRTSARGLLTGDRRKELLARAHALVAEGRPDALLLMPGWWYVTSAASLLDMERNVPRLLDAAPAVTCPVLCLRGELEDPALYPAEEFAAQVAGPAELRIIPGGDHFYTGREDMVGELIADWLGKVLA